MFAWAPQMVNNHMIKTDPSILGKEGQKKKKKVRLRKRDDERYWIAPKARHLSNVNRFEPDLQSSWIEQVAHTHLMHPLHSDIWSKIIQDCKIDPCQETLAGKIKWLNGLGCSRNQAPVPLWMESSNRTIPPLRECRRGRRRGLVLSVCFGTNEVTSRIEPIRDYQQEPGCARSMAKESCPSFRYAVCWRLTFCQPVEWHFECTMLPLNPKGIDAIRSNLKYCQSCLY